MSTIGIMDWDFMNYEHVIPNLECAKLYTYFHNHQEIAMLTPYLEPARYTKFFVRKEYNDGCYPNQLFADNCEYGGRAFTPEHYCPLAPDIEKTIPNMHLYDKYINNFGKTAMEHAQIRHILNCAHIRLSTDEINSKTMNQLYRIMSTGKYTGIIFHDYDLARITDAYDIIYELSQTREFKSKPGINPYAIGNKFPIQVHSSAELQQWLKVNSMPNLFCLQYNGIMDNEVLYNLCIENRRMARQLYYKIDDIWYDESYFIQYTLPQIFKQVLFLRRQHIKILLKYDDAKIISNDLRNFIDLLNCWLSFGYQEGFLSTTQTLFRFCKSNKKKHYHNWAFLHINISTAEARSSFQYIRENNYELFKMLYEWDAVVYEKGEFINEWRRD